MTYPGTAEFTFELLVCRWAELVWPPAREQGVSEDGGASTANDVSTANDDPEIVVARQLGTAHRRWDTVVIETDRDALTARRNLGTRTLDSDLLHVVRHAPSEWEWYRDALPHPGYPWRYVRAAVHRAAGRDLVETRRQGGRVELRRIAPYPEWAHRVIAIENKPDLDASAARALAEQLTHDVTAGLADEVWVATATTNDRVEPALLEDIPVEVGILTMDFSDGIPDAGTVAWLPTRLDRAATREDSTGVGEEVAATRRVLAERAYGTGWRSYVESMRPDCRYFELERHDRALLPRCAAKGCYQTSGECSGSCSAFEPEPPAWRTRGWPIEGGPGKAIGRLLDRRRERVRRRSVRDDDQYASGSSSSQRRTT